MFTNFLANRCNCNRHDREHTERIDDPPAKLHGVHKIHPVFQIKNGGFLFDSTRLTETLMCDLLSDLCGWGPFTKLNIENPNHPAIDLLSLDGKIGAQVTSTRSIEKVKDAIEKFVAGSET
ncbi:SMEK domain-containing protein [Paraburkholderia sp. 31.1]|uniref:SMEK domain-containing protein n=1 Tax=Paraburkholderia sp. 31.1 TaxID=2615205 RepID=UPI003974807F